MFVDIKTKSILKVDITPSEAFRILCKTLNMDYMLEEDVEFFVEKDCDGNNCVYIKNQDDRAYDDRGDLFIALRDVAKNIFPNLPFMPRGK